jgi:hyperosmotically inducible protein
MMRRMTRTKRSQRSRWGRFAALVAFTAAASAVMTYILDPDVGHRRRVMARDRGSASLRRGAHSVVRWRRAVTSSVYAYTQKIRHLRRGARPVPDDVTLTRKVESVLFRHRDVPKGRINVSVADGVVVLRGELEREQQIRLIGSTAHGVPGIRGVQNLLHLVGTPAPNKAAAREVAAVGARAQAVE